MIAVFCIVVLVGLIQGYSQLWVRQTKDKIKLTMREEGAALTEGDETTLWLVLENTSWLPIPWLEVFQKLPEEMWFLDGEEWKQEIRYHSYLLPRQRVQRRYVIRCMRGLHKFEKAELQFGDGVGLKDSHEFVESNAKILARPRLLEDVAQTLRLTELVGERSVQRWYQEDPSRLQGIRAYQMGDPFKQIHWAATARVGGLMVKQFETTSETDFYVVLNHQFFDAYWMGTNRAIVNETCRLAATLLYEAAEQGYGYGLYSNASWSGPGGLKVPLVRSATQFDAMVMGLGGIIYRSSGPFEDLLTSIRGRLQGNTTLAIITAMWNERIAEQVEQLRAEGFNILLFVDEERTGELVGLSPAVPVVALPFGEGEAELEVSE